MAVQEAFFCREIAIDLIYSVVFKCICPLFSSFLTDCRLLEQKFNRFLWSGSDSVIVRAKVGRKLICVPKRKGGLGLKRLEDWNKASMMGHMLNQNIQLHP
jgi:hypothetical protein